MATTTNYGWTTPDNTAYVKDGASAIRTLGSSVDTSLFNITTGKNVGLVLLNTTTMTAVSAQSVNDVFSTTYDNYRILVSMVGTTGQQANIRFRVGGADASGANYNHGRVSMVASAIAGQTSVSQTVGGIGNFANAERSFITADIFNPFLAVNTQWAGSSNQRQQSDFAVFNYSGSHNVDTSYTGFTLSAASGTLTGTISVYGYRK
jgi:hypothetical protein